MITAKRTAPDAPVTVNGLPVVEAVPVPADGLEVRHQWIVICDRGGSSGRGFLTWWVAWWPARQEYTAAYGCYDLTREEAAESLRQRTTGGRKLLQHLAP